MARQCIFLKDFTVRKDYRFKYICMYEKWKLVGGGTVREVQFMESLKCQIEPFGLDMIVNSELSKVFD